METGPLTCDAESLRFITGSPEALGTTGYVIYLAQVSEVVASFPQLMLYFGIHASEGCWVYVGYYFMPLCTVEMVTNKLVFLRIEPIPELLHTLLSSVHSNFLQYCLLIVW